MTERKNPTITVQLTKQTVRDLADLAHALSTCANKPLALRFRRQTRSFIIRAAVRQLAQSVEQGKIVELITTMMDCRI